MRAGDSDLFVEVTGTDLQMVMLALNSLPPIFTTEVPGLSRWMWCILTRLSSAARVVCRKHFAPPRAITRTQIVERWNAAFHVGNPLQPDLLRLQS